MDHNKNFDSISMPTIKNRIVLAIICIILLLFSSYQIEKNIAKKDKSNVIELYTTDSNSICIKETNLEWLILNLYSSDIIEKINIKNEYNGLNIDTKWNNNEVLISINDGILEKKILFREENISRNKKIYFDSYIFRKNINFENNENLYNHVRLIDKNHNNPLLEYEYKRTKFEKFSKSLKILFFYLLPFSALLWFIIFSTKINEKIGRYIYIVPIICILIYDGIFYKSYFPISEGWFSAYAHLINDGKIPYKDFYLLLPPLYPYFIASIQSVLGESIFILRVTGVLIAVLQVLTLYGILRERFSKYSSAVASTTSIIYYQSGNAFIGYDFTQLLSLFLLLSIYFSVIFRESQYYKLLISGILISCAFLTKQSNSTFAIIFSIPAILFLSTNNNRNAILKCCLFYISGLLIPILILLLYLLHNNTYIDFYNQVVIGAVQAKGSITTILFGWVPRILYAVYDNIKISAFLLILILLLLKIIFIIVNHYLKSIYLNFRILNQEKLLVLFTTFYILIIALSYSGEKYIPSNWQYYGIQYSKFIVLYSLLVTFLLPIIFYFKKDKFYIAIFFFIIGIIIGNGTSAGIGEISLYIPLSIALSFLGDTKKTFGLSKFILFLISLCLISQLSNGKFTNPYSWWDISSPNIRLSDTHPRNPLLHSLLIDKQSANTINEITQLVAEHSSLNDDILCYPNIPIFYLLTNRWPASKAIVQWFDFLPDTYAKLEAQRIRNAYPKIIINLELDNSIYLAHERLFRNEKYLGQRDIQSAILQLTEKDKLYKLLYTNKISGNTIIKVWELK